MKRKILVKILFSLFSSALFLFLSQIKFSQILGTKMRFSLAAILGPTLAKVFGIKFGTLIIILSQVLGTILGIFKFEGIKDLFVFFPIIFAGIFFAQILRGKKKQIVLPLLCISLFVLHPIGRQVWFYSLFWTIPVFLTFFKLPKFSLFGKSLATAFVDHGVGSVVYLYLLNIPAHFWIQAIPLTILERFSIGAGISISYILETQIIKFFLRIPFFSKIKELVFA